MKAFAASDLRQHIGDLVRNAESGQLSVVFKHGKPLFVSMPFTDRLPAASVFVALANKLVQSGEWCKAVNRQSALAQKLLGTPYARYLQRLGVTMGYRLLEDSAPQADKLTDELALRNSGVAASIWPAFSQRSMLGKLTAISCRPPCKCNCWPLLAS